MEERFGIPAGAFEGYRIYSKRKSWWLLREDPLLETACRIKVSMVGMRAFNRVGEFVKPTTRLIQAFGRYASKATLEINETQLRTLLLGESLVMDLDLENGYVILNFRGCPMGLGLYLKGRVVSQLPRKELKYLMK